jgi:hypothetical protein
MENFGTVAIAARVSKPDPIWVQCWTHLVMSAIDGDKVLPISYDLPHHFAAATLVHDFMTRTDCDTLLLVDDDMDFPRDSLERLRGNPANMAFDILSALYCTRHGDHGALPRPADIAAGGTVDVEHCGFGFTLIRRRAILAMGGNTTPGELMFRWPAQIVGEDVDFCRRARALGMRIGVDTTVPVGHRAIVTVTWDMTNSEPTYATRMSATWVKLAAQTEEARNGHHTDRNDP